MRINKTAGLFPLLCLLGSTAMAEGVYVGAKIGAMDADVSGFDDATNLGIVVGYTFEPVSDGISWALEGEFTTSVSDGDVNAFGSSGSWDVDTQALYGVLRIGGDLYGKLRLGYLREDVSASVAGVSADGSDDGVSGGLGVGWRASEQLSLELEYTLIEEDLDFYSVGANFAF
jgi:hypothetical protein